MARQVLPWVGAAVGAYFGNAQLGFMIGSVIGNAVDPQVIKGPSLGEGQNNTASEGGFRPIVLGKGRVGVCLIHEGPEEIRTIRTRQSKGGGPITEEQRRYRTMAFALGESAYPDQGVNLSRLWIDNKLRYDVTPTSQIQAESSAFASEFTFYPGNQTQQPDPDLEEFLGAGNVPSYRGGAPYIVFAHYDVTDSGGRAPHVLAELATDAVVESGGSIAIGRYAAVEYGTIKSSDGISWSAPFDNDPVGVGIGDPQLQGLIPSGERFISYHGSFANYSDDKGESWSDPVALASGTFGGPRSTEITNNRIVIPVRGSPILAASNDNGETFFNTGTVGVVAIAVRSSVGVGFIDEGTGGGYSAKTIDGGLSWSRSGVTGMYQYADSRWMAASDSLFALGGRDALLSGPAVSWTVNGDSWSVVSIASDPSVSVSILKWAKSPSHPDGRWVALLNNGDIYYADSVAGPWTQASDTLDGRFPTGLTHNGTRWIASGNTAGMSGGAIFTSEDGDVWTQRANALLGTAGVCSLSGASEIIDAGRIPLSTIVAFLHSRVGMPSSSYDVTALTDDVEGVVFADGYTAASAIGAAMAWYQFDAAEADIGSGYRINYIKRGGAAEATLTEDDIVDGPEDWEREDSYERPRVLHVAYPNPIADYGAPVIPIKRTSPDVLVVGERSVSVPFVTSDQDEIARRGDIAMTVIYTEIAGDYELVLPDSWLTLIPTSCIGFSIRGKTRRLRMTEWRYVDGTIKAKFKADRQSSYTSNLTALPAVPTSPPPPSIVGLTVSQVLDIPALVDSLDGLHMIVAHVGASEAWYGSVHQRKTGSDPDFTTALQFTRPASIMGVIEVGVTDASEHFTDTQNTVRVVLYADDEFQTLTEQQFLSENGAFALSWDDSGEMRWEIMQYRDAVKVADRTWELTTLMRGRLATETAEHPAGSVFVALDVGVLAMPAQSAWIGEDITHRAVSNGQLPDQAAQYVREYTGESQREWPVASIVASVSGDTLSASWIPRHRFGTDVAPVRSINWTGYRVTATDGVNSLSVDTLTEAHAFDVTGWSTPITVTVAQLNRITGAGPTVSEVVA